MIADDPYVARVHIDAQSLNITKNIKISQGQRLNQIQLHPNGMMHYTRMGSGTVNIYENPFLASGALDFSQEKLILEHTTEIWSFSYNFDNNNIYYAGAGSNNLYLRKQYPGILPNTTADNTIPPRSVYRFVVNLEHHWLIYRPNPGSDLYIAKYNESHTNKLTDIKLLYLAGISIYGLYYNPSENALYWRMRSTGVFRGLINHENHTISNVVNIMPSLTQDEGGIAVLHQ